MVDDINISKLIKNDAVKFLRTPAGEAAYRELFPTCTENIHRRAHKLLVHYNASTERGKYADLSKLLGHFTSYNESAARKSNWGKYARKAATELLKEAERLDRQTLPPPAGPPPPPPPPPPAPTTPKTREPIVPAPTADLVAPTPGCAVPSTADLVAPTPGNALDVAPTHALAAAPTPGCAVPSQDFVTANILATVFGKATEESNKRCEKIIGEMHKVQGSIAQTYDVAMNAMTTATKSTKVAEHALLTAERAHEGVDAVNDRVDNMEKQIQELTNKEIARTLFPGPPAGILRSSKKEPNHVVFDNTKQEFTIPNRIDSSKKPIAEELPSAALLRKLDVPASTTSLALPPEEWKSLEEVGSGLFRKDPVLLETAKSISDGVGVDAPKNEILAIQQEKENSVKNIKSTNALTPSKKQQPAAISVTLTDEEEERFFCPSSRRRSAPKKKERSHAHEEAPCVVDAHEEDQVHVGIGEDFQRLALGNDADADADDEDQDEGIVRIVI